MAPPDEALHQALPQGQVGRPVEGVLQQDGERNAVAEPAPLRHLQAHPQALRHGQSCRGQRAASPLRCCVPL